MGVSFYPFFRIVSFSILFLFISEAKADDFAQNLVVAAIERTKENVTYNPNYFSIEYPNGDVPKEYGVCTDVIIRSYRKLGIDLQEKIHEDMKANFHLYPNIWGLKKPDSNIDHRRVPNLQVYFSRHGKELPITDRAENYKPGDIVTWYLNGTSIPHIGIVTNKYINDVPMIVHNIGAGPKLENILFDYKITGHYRYKG